MIGADNSRRDADVVPHARDLQSLFEELASSEQGLDSQAAADRQKQWGPNELPVAPPTPAWKRFFSQFRNVLIYVLLGSALISLGMKHFVDSGVIFAVVLVNAIVGFIQEGKAESALRSIMLLARTHCLVVRGGALVSVDSAELVPGDVIMIQAGDRIPADVRLFYGKDLRCDESALTGESQTVDKRCETLAADTPLAERVNMAFMGTMVTYGVGRGVVTQTGVNTQIGQISEMVKTVELRPTPLQLQLSLFAHQLTIGILFLAIATILFGVYLRDYLFKDMFQAAIGIAVSSIPEGLPAIVTIALAIGVQRMASNHALVRRLPAVEVLGSVDVICTDKTGTLTTNTMTARELVMADGHYLVSGDGYTPEGVIELQEGGSAPLHAQDRNLTTACRVALLCNDANLTREQEEWVMHGDPTEGALLALAMKHGLTLEQENRDWPRIDVLPFDSETRYMGTLHQNAEGKVLLFIKGAPDRLLHHCAHELGNRDIEPLQLSRWQNYLEDFARRGMRVMALAYRELAEKPRSLSHADAEQDMVMIALVGISDPPRPEAIASIERCHGAGIRVKMITGDNPITAAAIGKELGLNTARVITGSDLDRLAFGDMASQLEDVEIFARTSPGHKLQLVKAFQSNRHVVAMTGDGVNDAPALRQADIGVAMGMKGTDAAKEASDFVLTDDNFSTIAKAVESGRTVYANIIKSIIFVLPTSLAEASVIIIAILLGRLLPITPAQILWINMITTVTLALALAFERTEPNIMAQPPRRFGQSLLDGGLFVRTCLVGLYGAAVVFTLFSHYNDQGGGIEVARTIAVNALVMIEVFYLFNCRLLTRSIFCVEFFAGIRPSMLAAITVLLLQLGFSYWPVSQRLFGLASIGATDWFVIIVCTMPVILFVESEKWLARRLEAAKASREAHAVPQG